MICCHSTAISYRLLSFNVNELKNKVQIQCRSFTTLLSSTPQPHVNSSYPTGQHRHRTFASSQKVLLDTMVCVVYISHIASLFSITSSKTNLLSLSSIPFPHKILLRYLLSITETCLWLFLLLQNNNNNNNNTIC